MRGRTRRQRVAGPLEPALAVLMMMLIKMTVIVGAVVPMIMFHMVMIFHASP